MYLKVGDIGLCCRHIDSSNQKCVYASCSVVGGIVSTLMGSLLVSTYEVKQHRIGS